MNNRRNKQCTFHFLKYALNATPFSPYCELCKYNAECVKFQECFVYIPKFQWSQATSFYELINSMNKWREFNNGTTVKH